MDACAGLCSSKRRGRDIETYRGSSLRSRSLSGSRRTGSLTRSGQGQQQTHGERLYVGRPNGPLFAETPTAGSFGFCHHAPAGQRCPACNNGTGPRVYRWGQADFYPPGRWLEKYRGPWAGQGAWYVHCC